MALVNEIQRITVRGAGDGGIRLTVTDPSTYPFLGNPTQTDLIPYNATAQEVQDAINTLGAGSVFCSATGGPLNTEPVDVEFDGLWVGHNVPQMELDATDLVMEEN